GHVIFDGWGPDSFAMAASDCEVTLGDAKAACPRGALDLAADFHKAGDVVMLTAADKIPLSEMRIRDRVSALVMARLDAAEDKELVRRGSSLFALPGNASEGAALIWGTADAIWTALGDTSEDGNWYSKRAVLSGVYGSTVLYWLGDETPDHQATREFLDRRIENVMQFEKAKAHAQKLPLVGGLISSVMSNIKAPGTATRDDLPGTMNNRT
ncbi:MAG: COQ9 family protein, partial [Halocynthiibacter sp.]